jgi:hypothetical protein
MKNGDLPKTKHVCIRERKETLKFDGGEEIQSCTECTYLGTETTEIKHRISQTRKAINALNTIHWHKNITKNKKLYTYQTINQSRRSMANY